MSDRGYKALALELEVKAIEIEVQGMIAENQVRAHRGESPVYGEAEFYFAAGKVRECAKKVRVLLFTVQPEETDDTEQVELLA